jgi:hypothetical protein
MFWRTHHTKPELKSMWLMPLRLWEHIKDEAKGIILENFTFDGNRHQTGDAAFVPASQNLQHSRANTYSYNSHNTKHVGVKQNELCFMPKGTQPSQACSGGQITTDTTRNRYWWSFFACGEYKLD